MKVKGIFGITFSGKNKISKMLWKNFTESLVTKFFQILTNFFLIFRKFVRNFSFPEIRPTFFLISPIFYKFYFESRKTNVR